MPSRCDVEAQLTALEEMGTKELQAKWRELYGTPPPKKSRRDFLMRAVAHRLQENAYGGLRAAPRKRLHDIAARLRAGKIPTFTGKSQRSKRLTPGTRLVREWNGDTHVVDVTEDGYAFRGKGYASLSAVARAITGARWSGPRFFGLTGQKEQAGYDAGSGS